MLSFGSRRRAAALLATFAMSLVLAACAGGVSSGPGGKFDEQRDGADVAPGGTAGPAPHPADGEAPGGGNGDGTGVNALDRPDLLIIKTGSIVIQVAGIDASVEAATKAIVALGGYASASERSGEDDDAYASVTYRVPADRWDEALAAIRGLGSKVLDERTGTQDVTGEVVDLAARIRNLQATEAAFQEIMTRATEIKDVLAVQAELTQVRGEIERLTAQKTRLEEQAALSTLSVTFSLKPNPILTSQERFDPAAETEALAQAVAVVDVRFTILDQSTL